MSAVPNQCQYCLREGLHLGVFTAAALCKSDRTKRHGARRSFKGLRIFQLLECNRKRLFIFWVGCVGPLPIEVFQFTRRLFNT